MPTEFTQDSHGGKEGGKRWVLTPDREQEEEKEADFPPNVETG